MKIDIIIVNWNAGQQLADCIASVRQYGGDKLGACIVVDNGSIDGSTDFLDGASDVQLVRTGQNLGFAKASNLGASRGTSDYLLLLNPDACLFRNSVTVPGEYLSDPEHAQVGIVGIQLVDEGGNVQRSCTRFPTSMNFVAKSFGLTSLFRSLDFHMNDWRHDQTKPVDHIMGAFFMIRRNLFLQLAGLDERFFVYLEDLDLSLRARQQGFTSVYLTEAQAYHKGGGVSEQVKAHRLFYSLRSRMLYARKHFSLFAAISVMVATLSVEFFSRLGLLLVTRRWSEIPDLWRGYRMLWSWTLAWLRGKS